MITPIIIIIIIIIIIMIIPKYVDSLFWYYISFWI